MLLFRLCSRRGLGVTRRTSRDCREDQEARQDAVLPQEVASLHLGHLLGYQGVRGQQQHWKWPSGPGPESGFHPGSAQIQLRRVPEGLRTQRHPSLMSYTNPLAGSRPFSEVFSSWNVSETRFFVLSFSKRKLSRVLLTRRSLLYSPLASVSRFATSLDVKSDEESPSPVFCF